MTAERLSTRAKLMPILSLVSACVFALAGIFVLGIFANLTAEHDMQVNDLTMFILEHRYWLGLVVLPAIAFSFAGTLTRSGFARILLAVLSGLSLAAVFVIILYVAITTLAPLYEYQSL